MHLIVEDEGLAGGQRKEVVEDSFDVLVTHVGLGARLACARGQGGHEAEFGFCLRTDLAGKGGFEPVPFLLRALQVIARRG
jgi:hypothetical protein